MKKYFFFIGSAFLFIHSSAQMSGKMDFEKYNPPSTLVVTGHKVAKAKYPFIDVHNHQFSMPDMDLSNLITEMDKLNMKVMVNLSGQSGELIKKSVANIKRSLPEAIYCFCER